MRKEQKNQTRVNKGYNHEISAAHDHAMNMHDTSNKNEFVYERTNNHILALKAKAETEKFNFEKKIKEL